MPHIAKQSNTMHSKAMHSRVIDAMQGTAKHSKAMRNKARQTKAVQCKGQQSNDKQSQATQCRSQQRQNTSDRPRKVFATEASAANTSASVFRGRSEIKFTLLCLCGSAFRYKYVSAMRYKQLCL